MTRSPLPFLLGKNEERYYCRIRPLAFINDSGFELPVLSAGGTPADARELPDAPNVEENETGNNAINIGINEPGAHTWKAEVDNPGTNTVQATVRCCAVSGKVKYNTLAADFNILELLNGYREVVNTTVIVIGNSGVELTRVNVTIPANGRSDVLIHDLVPGGFGTVKIIHDGPADTISGFVAFYKNDNGTLLLNESIPVRFPRCRE